MRDNTQKFTTQNFRSGNLSRMDDLSDLVSEDDPPSVYRDVCHGYTNVDSFRMLAKCVDDADCFVPVFDKSDYLTLVGVVGLGLMSFTNASNYGISDVVGLSSFGLSYLSNVYLYFNGQ